MNLIDAVSLGIVEGISEFLPISSTGHLILTAKIMGLTQTEFLKTFEIAIQLGAVLAVVFLYWKKLLVNRDIFLKVAAAFIPTAILGAIFYKIIKSVLLDSQKVVLVSLFVGGILLIIFEYFHKEKAEAVDDLEKISYKNAILIGLFQSISMVPGVSRSAATILGGLLLGLKRKTIVEFSFLLAVPTMMAATGLDLLKSHSHFSSDQLGFLLVGLVVSFVVALLSVKFLLHFIQKHNFAWFGVYRILVAVLFWFIIY